MRRTAALPGAPTSLALTLALTLGLAPALPGARAQAQGQGRTPVRAETLVFPDSVRLGDPVTVRWRVWLPKGSTAAFPPRPADDSLFHWSGWKVETRDLKGAYREHRLTATFQSFALGPVTLPGVPVRFTVPGEAPRDGRFPTNGFVVVPTIPPGGADPPLKDLKPLLPPPWWALVPWLQLALGVALAALLVFLVWRWWRRRRRAAPAAAAAEATGPAEPPEVEARRRLAALVALRLPEQGRVLEHGTELADLLHRFVERRFGSPQPGDTTGELSRRLVARGHATPADAEALRGILSACDLTKFARRPYDAARAHEAEAVAERLIATWTAPAAAAPGGPATPDAPATPGAPARGAA